MCAAKVTGKRYHDEDNDSDKQKCDWEREIQGGVAMEMTCCQLPHPSTVAGWLIGFEMVGGTERRGCL